MKNINLNQEQIYEVIKNKKVTIDTNSTIEIYDDEIIYNENGVIKYALNLKIEFGKKEQTDSFLQEIICEHFNIDKNQVITVHSEPKDAEFRIRFTPENEITIIVCPINTAIKNTNILEENNGLKFNRMNPQIGLYRRLGNSAYFFRIDYI